MPPADGAVPLLSGIPKSSKGVEAVAEDAGRGFSFVMVFPLPSETTEEEEKEFQKHLPRGETCRDLLLHTILHDGVRADPSCLFECEDTLKSLRTATIEVFRSLFESVVMSHNNGDPNDDSSVFTFTSVDRDELFMCVKFSDHVSEVLADMIEYPVQLTKESLEPLKILISGNQVKDLVPAYVKYDAFQKDSDYLKTYDRGNAHPSPTIFPQKDRIRIIYDRIGSYVNLPEYKRLGALSHTFPSHTDRINKELEEEWANLKLFYTTVQPHDKIREYFGEEIAFYFLFVERVAVAQQWLILLAVLYTLLSWFGPQDEFKDLPRVLYSAGLQLWFFCFIKHWRRTEAYYANKWGTDRDVTESELRPPVNPNFSGIMVGSAVDENRMELKPIKWKRQMGITTAVVAELFFQGFVIVVLLALQITYTKFVDCESKNTPPCKEEKLLGIDVGAYGSTVASILLSISIKVFNLVWTPVAELLCDLEQHVHLHEWNSSRTGKIFRFQFISTFWGFCVLVVLPLLDKDSGQDQMTLEAQSLQALTKSLKTCFVLYVSFGVLDMAIPWISLKWAVYSEKHALEKSGKESFQLSMIEEQAKMLEYTGADAADDYMAIIFPAGFVALFSMAMPLFSVCFSYIAAITQIRADAWKLCKAYRRPFPEMVSGIGKWNDVLEIFALCMVILNGLQVTTQLNVAPIVKKLLPLTEAHYEKDPEIMQAFVFFMFITIFFAARLMLDKLVADVDSRTELERRRQDLQRIHLFQTSTGDDFKEKVVLKCTGNNDLRRFEELPQLKPGDPMYIAADEKA